MLGCAVLLLAQRPGELRPAGRGELLCAVLMCSRADGAACGLEGLNVGNSFYGQK